MSTLKRPGWYAAPDRNGEQWWNGVSWSESRRMHRAIPPAASVAYNAQTGMYGTPGAPTALPTAPTNGYQQQSSSRPVVTSRTQGRVFLAVLFAVVSLSFVLFAIPAIFLAVVARRKIRAVRGSPLLAFAASIAIGLSIVAIALFALRAIGFSFAA